MWNPCAKKPKQGTYSLFSIRGKCSSAGEQSSILVVVSWENKCHHLWHPIFLILSPSFHCWAWYHMVNTIPLVTLGQLSWTASCVPPFSSLMGQQEKQKHPWLYVSISQQKIQYLCYYYFHQQSKTWHCKSCYEKNYFSQNHGNRLFLLLLFISVLYVQLYCLNRGLELDEGKRVWMRQFHQRIYSSNFSFQVFHRFRGLLAFGGNR